MTEKLEYICNQKLLQPRQIQQVSDIVSKYKDEYDASIKIGLTSKNYAEREKAFYNAQSVMQENGINVLPASFNRKPSDIIYSMDFAIRRMGITDADFRRSLLWLLSDEDKRLPKVSDDKDEEIEKQEEQMYMSNQVRV